MRFPVGNIVEESGEFHHEQVGTFRLADPPRHLPDPVDVPPVVAAGLTRECGLYVVGGKSNEFGRGHGVSRLRRQADLPTSAQRFVELDQAVRQGALGRGQLVLLAREQLFEREDAVEIDSAGTVLGLRHAHCFLRFLNTLFEQLDLLVVSVKRGDGVLRLFVGPQDGVFIEGDLLQKTRSPAAARSARAGRS